VSEASGRDPVQDFQTVRRELALFDRTLLDRRQIVAANKMDVLADRDRLARLQAEAERLGLRLYPMSAVTGDGVRPLLEAMWQRIATAREEHRVEPALQLPDTPGRGVAE